MRGLDENGSLPGAVFVASGRPHKASRRGVALIVEIELRSLR